MAVKNTAKESYKFYDFTHVICSVDCTRCGMTETAHQCDEQEFIDYLIEMKWRVRRNHCYCPKCAKKYLKK